ncbi:MAG: MucR family transcriptional regulator [Proteobacteria bacterium]|nr:MucR family transcriptional regulator [Pseudomonadota bacterium]
MDTTMPPEQKKVLAEVTARVVAAYVSRHPVPAGGLAGVIRTVGDRFAALRRAKPALLGLRPALSPARAIGRAHVTCLLCGRKLSMLKRHLLTAHEITPAEYREMFGLTSAYPLVAPDYAKHRSQLAKRMGLGRKRAAAEGAKAKG